MGDVTVTADLVAGVDDDHALAALVAEHACAFAQHRRLADARRAEQEDRLPVDHDVLDDVDGAGDRAPHPAGEADDGARAVADCADAVQRPLDSRSVVVAEVADALGDVLEVVVGDLDGVEDHLAIGEPRLRLATQVEHDLEEVTPLLGHALRGDGDPWRQRFDEEVELLLP